MVTLDFQTPMCPRLKPVARRTRVLYVRGERPCMSNCFRMNQYIKPAA